MRKIQKACFVVLVALFTLGTISFQVHAGQDAPQITVKTGKKHNWTYTHEQLLAMATEEISNQKRTRMKPAIPLEALLFKDTGMSLEMVREVFIMTGHGMITIVRGDDLAFLDKLVLVSGPDKNGKPHIWSLAPDNEAMYRTISHFLGANRKHGVVRIDITEKVTAVQ